MSRRAAIWLCIATLLAFLAALLWRDIIATVVVTFVLVWLWWGVRRGSRA